MSQEPPSGRCGQPTPQGTIKVAIIEDERDIREGLATILKVTEDHACTCTGAYHSMEEALDRIKNEEPQVALVDIGLPGMNGIEGIRLLRQHHPNLLLLMLTVYDDDEYIFDALCAGATGYLLKKTAPARLIECLREAMEGGATMSPEVAGKIIKLFREVRPPERADYDLTPLELGLLKLLAEGHNYKTAAAELGVGVATIADRTRNIYDKLQVHSRSGTVARALRNRLV